MFLFNEHLYVAVPLVYCDAGGIPLVNIGLEGRVGHLFVVTACAAVACPKEIGQHDDNDSIRPVKAEARHLVGVVLAILIIWFHWHGLNNR